MPYSIPFCIEFVNAVMCNKSKAVFKRYDQKQAMLLPPDLDELAEQNHPVRVINAVIDNLDIDALLKKYKGGGTSSYHPRMLLKVLVYAYICNEYSSRRIEEAVKRDVQFMWLAGMTKPDHNTINRFRSERLKDVLKTVLRKWFNCWCAEGSCKFKRCIY
jgi:transposase